MSVTRSLGISEIRTRCIEKFYIAAYTAVAKSFYSKATQLSKATYAGGCGGMPQII